MSKDKDNRTTHVEKARHIIYGLGEKRPSLSSPLPLAKIPLSNKPVAPDSIKLHMLGEEIIPTFITHDGVPKFSEKASLILYCKEHIARHGRLVGTEKQEVNVIATYTECEPPLYGKEEIDTAAGIQNALTSLEDFYSLCQKRAFYSKSSPGHLHCFIVYGRIMLDEHGYIRRLDRIRDHIYNLNIEPEELPIVCTREEFDKYATTYDCSNAFRIPAPGEKCPICGREFTIEDLKEALTTMNTGMFQEVVHDKCKHQYEYHLEIKTLVFDIADHVYPGLCKFEILSNPNLLDKVHSHIPWILIHTQDGDIKLGHKYQRINIEWQPNFRPFDISGLNNMQNCVKWADGCACSAVIMKGTTSTTGVRGISVDKVSDAVEALKQAHNLAFFSK